MSVKDELESIFNSIPSDGSNIRDEEDDNGYENIGGAAGQTLEEKASVLADKLKVAPPVVELPLPKKAEALAWQKPAEQVAPTPVTSTPEDMGKALKEAILSTPVNVSEPAGTIDFDEVDLPIKAEQTGPLETATEVKSGRETADKSSVEVATPTPEEKPAEGTFDAVEEESFDVENWFLSSPNPKYDDFFKSKRRTLSYILPGGKLPFEQYHRELLEANVDPNVVTYDLNTLYERMQEVQQWKHRVLEIKLHGEHQYFFWKRHMEMFRSMAARLEGLKAAAVDSGALNCLWDFEKYWCQLEALVKKAEGVMRNLEGAFECLSRQVTIALPQREIERFEPRETKSRESTFRQPPPQELGQFDSLDATSSPAKKPAQSEGGWEEVR